jgi:hypothetical protein
MLPKEYDSIAIKDYDAEIDKHALYGCLRKLGYKLEIINGLKQKIHEHARSCPRDQKSTKELLILEKKLTNLVYSLLLSGWFESINFDSWFIKE